MSATIILHNVKVKRIFELKYSQAGNPYMAFTCAVPTKKGEETHFDWYTVTMFGQQAEYMSEHIAVGSRLTAFGSLTAELYDKQDGGVGLNLKVSANRVEFCGEAPQHDGDEQPAKKSAPAKPPVKKPAKPAEDDDPGF
jgi:single-strand DNA-binding protein